MGTRVKRLDLVESNSPLIAASDARKRIKRSVDFQAILALLKESIYRVHSFLTASLKGGLSCRRVREAIQTKRNLKEFKMAKPGRTLKKANHGKRPANAKARRAKRRIVKT